jgi:hypothetical protein
MCGWLVPYVRATLLRLPTSAASRKSFHAAYSIAASTYINSIISEMPDLSLQI